MNFFPASLTSTRARRGFTLVELLIAMTILIVAMLGAIGTISTISTLGESNRESTLAYQAARAMLETVSSENFEDVFARYNSDPADDPIFAGSGPGPNFAVANLDAQVGDADGLPGRVLLPESAGALLLETMIDSSFGMPRDLDGSGGIDAANHASDYILLPVRVRVEWTGKSGDRFVEYATILGEAPVSSRRKGYTLIEITIALSILTTVLFGVFMAANSGQKTFRRSVSNSVVNTKANRTLNRIAKRLRGAGLSTLFPQPVSPFGSETLSFLEVTGWNNGPTWSEDMQFRLEYDTNEIANDADDDNDGFVDECQVVLVERLGQPDEVRTVLVRDVMEFLQGETPNGVDDNANGLDDERGLCFELRGSTLIIRLSVMHRDPEGGISRRTLETSVGLRN